MKEGDVLMVMVPRRDTDFRGHRKHRPGEHEWPSCNHSKHEQIDRKECQKYDDGQSIFGKSKNGHARRVIYGTALGWLDFQTQGLDWLLIAYPFFVFLVLSLFSIFKIRAEDKEGFTASK